MVDENRSLMNTTGHRQKNLLGHVLRSESLAYRLRRQNGRDKNSWKTECYDEEDLIFSSRMRVMNHNWFMTRITITRLYEELRHGI